MDFKLMLAVFIGVFSGIFIGYHIGRACEIYDTIIKRSNDDDDTYLNQ